MHYIFMKLLYSTEVYFKFDYYFELVVAPAITVVVRSSNDVAERNCFLLFFYKWSRFSIR